MRPVLRFPFTATDQAAITVSYTDEPPSAEPQPAQPPPQSLRIDVSSTSLDAVRVLPLFAGQFGFTRLSDGLLPTPEQVVTTDPATWGTRGRLWFRPYGKAARKQVKVALRGMPVRPNRIYLEPVTLTSDFLLETLVQQLQRRTIERGGRRIRPSHDGWEAEAISAFLAGDYWPTFRIDQDDPDLDVAVTHPWPVLDLVGGSASLWITLAKRARRRPPDTGRRDLGPKSFDDPMLGYPDVPLTVPSHPRNGTIPARLVYHHVLDDLVDGDPGNLAADALRAAPSRYRHVQFTRTWKPGWTESVYLPLMTASAGRNDPTDHHLRIPHHGHLWFPEDDDAPLRVAVSAPMAVTWISGAIPDAWQQASDTVPIDLAPSDEHVIVRIPWVQDLMVERAFRPMGERCTYMNIRRWVRAMIEHRITGGLLHHRWTTHERRVRRLMDEAWTDFGVAGVHFAKNQPPPRAVSSDNAGDKLIAALHAFYPEPVSPGGLSKGHTTYWLWQSAYGYFGDPSMEDLLLGYGGPGAIELLGATVRPVAADPGPRPTSTGHELDNVAAWLNRIFVEMTTKLEYPALLQFWTVPDDFLRLQAYREEPIPEGTELSDGHSLLFVGYRTAEDGTVLLDKVDQYGEGTLEASETYLVLSGGLASTILLHRVHWDGEPRAIWAGANIDENLAF